jgi:hypothetical protein
MCVLLTIGYLRPRPVGTTRETRIDASSSGLPCCLTYSRGARECYASTVTNQSRICVRQTKTPSSTDVWKRVARSPRSARLRHTLDTFTVRRRLHGLHDAIVCNEVRDGARVSARERLDETLNDRPRRVLGFVRCLCSSGSHETSLRGAQSTIPPVRFAAVPVMALARSDATKAATSASSANLVDCRRCVKPSANDRTSHRAGGRLLACPTW